MASVKYQVHRYLHEFHTISFYQNLISRNPSSITEYHARRHPEIIKRSMKHIKGSSVTKHPLNINRGSKIFTANRGHSGLHPLVGV